MFADTPKEDTMARSNRAALALALCALLIPAVALTGCTTKVVSAPANSSINTVTSSGSGTVSAAPDIAVMSFGVSATSNDAKKALDSISGKAKTVTDALKKAGVAEKDIQTQNVSVYPQTDQNNKVTGYQASLTVSAKVRDLASLSDVIGAASAAGVDSINGPTFSISEDAPYADQAMKKAVDDARRTADAMAKAAGKSVGTVVSMTSNTSGGISPLIRQSAADATAKGVPIEPGQLDVTADVTVVFELR
jgi:uncharacterized protein